MVSSSNQRLNLWFFNRCNAWRFLTKAPRSGSVPEVLEESGESGPDGWILRLTIDHAGQRRDGLQVAQAAVDAWRRALERWGLPVDDP